MFGKEAAIFFEHAFIHDYEQSCFFCFICCFFIDYPFLHPDNFRTGLYCLVNNRFYGRRVSEYINYLHFFRNRDEVRVAPFAEYLVGSGIYGDDVKSVTVEITGADVDFETVAARIGEMGGSVHSVDEVEVEPEGRDGA